MKQTNSLIRVYSLPDCHKCDELKSWLKDKGLFFESKWFDTEAQTEFVMRNIFGNPPIIEFGEKCVAAEDMFPEGILNVDVVREILGIKEG
jgi:glutaredoxin